MNPVEINRASDDDADYSPAQDKLAAALRELLDAGRDLEPLLRRYRAARDTVTAALAPMTEDSRSLVLDREGWSDREINATATTADLFKRAEVIT